MTAAREAELQQLVEGLLRTPLSVNAKLVGCAALVYPHASRAQLAELAGVSLRTVQRATRELREAGWPV